MKEAMRQATMSQGEKIQQAEELHSSGQLTDAELEAIRIKSAAEKEFNKFQTNSQAAQTEEVVQVAQEKIERLLAEEAKEAQSSEFQKGNKQGAELQEVDVPEETP